MENFREVRAFGMLFVFWGIWEGVRNRLGCGCVWDLEYLGSGHENGGDVDVFGGMGCVGGE